MRLIRRRSDTRIRFVRVTRHKSKPQWATVGSVWSLAIKILAFASIGCAGGAAAQAPATQQSQGPQQARSITVTGSVRNAVGEPVAGASVFLEGSGKPVEATTNPAGAFTISAEAGTYTLRAEKAGAHSKKTVPLRLASGTERHIDLLLPPIDAMEFKDEPDFTVAGVTDWSNVGLHGSDTTSRTSEALAKETLTLKSGSAEKGSAAGDKYKPALESEARGDLRQAREQARKALAVADDAEGHHVLADIDERLGDPLAAVREYERAARMYPSEQNYFDWGAELLLHKAAQPAVEVFTRGSGLHPDSARMLSGLAAALYGVGSYDDASRRLCAASDLRPADPAPYLFLGQMERTVSTPLPCGEEKLARFAQIQPANALANYYYAISLWKRQRGSENAAKTQQIEALLGRAVALDPRLGEAYVQLGMSYFARNDFPRAIEAYQQAIKVSPQLAEGHYRLSLVYKRTGEDAKAHEEFAAYQQAEKTETAAVERQRRELKQFLVILKNQSAPAPN
jgi:tetratricopeptide (TPR) repeat protein